MNHNYYHLNVISAELNKRQSSNPNYSLRAFARDLEINPSTLSQILRGKRKLNLPMAIKITKKLELKPENIKTFLDDFKSSNLKIDKIEVPVIDSRKIIDNSNYEILAQWEHFATLELFDIFNNQLSPFLISENLNIDIKRSRKVIKNLLTVNLIKNNEDGTYSKICEDIKTTEDIFSKGLIDGHLENLDIAKEKLIDIESHNRDFSSIMFAIDKSMLPEAKKIIREFRQKMSCLFLKGNKEEVYQLSIQLFPLTQNTQLNKRKEA